MDGMKILTEQKKEVFDQQKKQCSTPWNSEDHKFQQPAPTSPTTQPKFATFQLILLIRLLESTSLNTGSPLLQVQHKRQTEHEKEMHPRSPLLTPATKTRQPANLSRLK